MGLGKLKLLEGTRAGQEKGSIYGNEFTRVKTSHRRCPLEKAALKNFAIFTGKHLCRSLFLINLQAFRPTTSLKTDPNTGVSCEYCKILRTPILKNIYKQLLLKGINNFYNLPHNYISHFEGLGDLKM